MNGDPRMYNLYTDYLDMLEEEGVDLFSNFSMVGEWSKWDGWGVLRYQDQPIDEAHKYRALIDWLTDNPAPTAPAPGTVDPLLMQKTYLSRKVNLMRINMLLVLLMLLGLSLPAQAGLELESLGQDYQRDATRTPEYLFAAHSNRGGSTSIRNCDAETIKWKDKGYYQRNRDLGQVFNIPEGETVKIDAIVLRTGNSDTAILEGAPGAEVFIQFFEVTGDPTIDDNGTPPGTQAKHGFTKNHRADDHIQGVDYKSLRVVRGGNFPDIPPTTKDGGETGHLHYIRWDLTGEDEIVLEGGKRYAFMVGFAEPGKAQGFTLGNHNQAADRRPPKLLTDPNGQEWWGIRREGDGTLPPHKEGQMNFRTAESFTREELKQESLFTETHFDLEPVSEGYPDVDTYRTFEFYIEASE